MKESAQASAQAPALPNDYGTWAYETNPIDITGNGPVTLTVQVPASLNVNDNGDGVGTVFPPDKQFMIYVKSYTETQNGDGTSDIDVQAVVSDFEAPYYGFDAWLY